MDEDYLCETFLNRAHGKNAEMSRSPLNRRQSHGPSTGENKEALRRLGYAISVGSTLFGLFFFYIVALSQLQPWTSNRVIDAISENNYYILLLPVLMPTMAAFSWVNWFGMQSFRRN